MLLFYFENLIFNRVAKIGNNFKFNFVACFCLYLRSTFKEKKVSLGVIGTLIKILLLVPAAKRGTGLGLPRVFFFFLNLCRVLQPLDVILDILD